MILQINTGEYKINNIWILLKRSLTIWLFPIFIVSFLFNEITISDGYLLGILLFYIIFITLNYFGSNKIVFFIDKIILLFLSLLIFANNRISIETFFFSVIALSFLVALVYVIAFFYYKKHNKNFILNFSKLSNFIELILAVSIVFFGIKNIIVTNILFFAMCDIFYKIVILSIIFNLKKRFSIQ